MRRKISPKRIAKKDAAHKGWRSPVCRLGLHFQQCGEKCTCWCHTTKQGDRRKKVNLSWRARRRARRRR